MTRVSRIKLDYKRLQEITEQFSYLISTLREATEIENFLNEFFTKEEKIMVSKRLMLFMMLKKEYSTFAIKSALNVSYETVRTYQQQLYYKNSLFHKTLEKLITRENTKIFFSKLEKLLKPLELALKVKTNMKARAKLTSRDY